MTDFLALKYGCYMLIIILMHGNQVPEAKMTVHTGFVKLRMAVTTYNNISSQVTEAKMTVHI